MKKDIILTYATEFFSLAASLITYKLAAVLLGNDGFANYALSRRIATLIQSGILMGLSVGITRYISCGTYGKCKDSTGSYFISGIVIVSLALIIFSVVFQIFKSEFAFLLFGSTKYIFLISPINIIIAGFIFHTLSYSYFRGKLFMKMANLMSFINMGLITVFAFLFNRSLTGGLYFIGLGWLLVSAFFLCSILVQLGRVDVHLIKDSKKLLIYSFPRALGDFALGLLYSLPIIFTAHIADTVKAGYLAFGVSLVNMMGVFVSPISLMLLPKAGELISQGNLTLLKHIATKTVKTTLFTAILIVVFFELFASQLIWVYLGKSFVEIALVCRIVILGSLGTVIFYSIKGILDASYVKPINTRNIIVSLGLFLLLSGVSIISRQNYLYFAVAFVLAVSLLAILTFFETKLVFERNKGV